MSPLQSILAAIEAWRDSVIVDGTISYTLGSRLKSYTVTGGSS